MPTPAILHSLFRSIRFRIAGWNALAVAAITLLALLGLRQAVKWTLLREIDQILEEDVRIIELAVRETPAGDLESLLDELRRKTVGHAKHGWFVSLTDVEGRTVWSSEDERAEKSNNAERPSRGADEHESLRVTRTAAPANALGIADVELGCSLDMFRQDLSRLDRILGGIAALILLAAPFCGYWLAGIATKDLESLTATAARLRPARLDERLPYHGANDEFDRLALTINGLLDRIAAYLAEKRSFLANAAHELRTPIAAIRSSIEVALGADRSKDDYRHLLEELIEETASLETLVNQVLLLSEATGALERDVRGEAPLSSIVAKSVEMFHGVAEQKGVRLAASIAEGIVVPGDKQHLRQVVNNLVDNAVKYCRIGEEVIVSLADDPARRAVVLEVRDTGPGIVADDVPRVFERFFRGDRARQRNETRGTGLGLSICQTIVEAHGGTIRCDSREGAGATFTVSLPSGQRT
ncbi:MAG: HAMP domain-containing protein [Pirellulales bacterium]|nr:HAMP domain-containing protein [Pirellulales bacterium]